MTLFPARARSSDQGFTLLEIIVAISVASIMMMGAAGAYRSWSAAAGQRGTAEEIVQVLASVQQRAITEGRTYCVNFDTGANTYSVLRGACNGTNVAVDQPITPNNSAVLSSPQFIQSDASITSYVQFTPHGSASPGLVVVDRPGSKTWYVVKVEGLTGRSWYEQIPAGSCTPVASNTMSTSGSGSNAC